MPVDEVPAAPLFSSGRLSATESGLERRNGSLPTKSKSTHWVDVENRRTAGRGWGVSSLEGFEHWCRGRAKSAHQRGTLSTSYLLTDISSKPTLALDDGGERRTARTYFTHHAAVRHGYCCCPAGEAVTNETGFKGQSARLE